MSETPLIIGDSTEVDKYSQKELDKVLRPSMVDLALMPLGKLMELVKDPEAMKQVTAFQATWAQVLLRGALKGDMMPAIFMQEHLVGKAIQRIQSESVTYTYQDLLHRIKKAENKYQVVASTVVDAEVVESAPKTWEDLL